MSGSLSPAGLHSFPNRSSTGRALNWVARGQPLCNPDRAGSSRQHLLDGRQPRGGVLGRRLPFIPLRSELAGDPAQDFTDRRPSGGLAFHGSNHEGSHDREVVKACQGIGNVCRA